MAAAAAAAAAIMHPKKNNNEDINKISFNRNDLFANLAKLEYNKQGGHYYKTNKYGVEATAEQLELKRIKEEQIVQKECENKNKDKDEYENQPATINDLKNLLRYFEVTLLETQFNNEGSNNEGSNNEGSSNEGNHDDDDDDDDDDDIN
jgi:hypothetical protein